ncbi:MAG: hypothetical protein SGARI_001777, partial [Bacillariaceae sp.]
MPRPSRKASKPEFYSDIALLQVHAPKKKARLANAIFGQREPKIIKTKHLKNKTKAKVAGATHHFDVAVFSCIASFSPVETGAVLREVCPESREAFDLKLKTRLPALRSMELEDYTSDDTVTELTLRKGWSKHNKSKDDFVQYACSEGWDKDGAADNDSERIILLTQRTQHLVDARMNNCNSGWADQEDFLKGDNDTMGADGANLVDLTGMESSTDEDRDENKDDGSLGSALSFGVDKPDVESICSNEHAAYKATFNNIDQQLSDTEEEADLSWDDESEDLDEEALEEDLGDDEYDSPSADLFDDAHFDWRCRLTGDHSDHVRDSLRGWGTDVMYNPSISKEEALAKAKFMLGKVCNQEHKLEMKLLVQYLVKNAREIRFSHYKCHYRHEGNAWQEWALLFECEGL